MQMPKGNRTIIKSQTRTPGPGRMLIPCVPIGAAGMPRYDRIRAEKFVEKYALPKEGRPGQRGNQGERFALGAKLAEAMEQWAVRLDKREEHTARGPTWKALITSRATAAGPRSGRAVSVGDPYVEQLQHSKATRNGELMPGGNAAVQDGKAT